MYETFASPAPLVAGHLATDDGHVLRTYRAGPPDGPAVVCANAFGMPIDFWAPLARELVDRYAVHAWDARVSPGNGPWSNDADASVDAHVRDLAAVAGTAGTTGTSGTAGSRPVLVLGWCTGAHVALAFAAAHPERVAGLVLLNGAYRFGDDDPTTPHQRHFGQLLPRVVRTPKMAAMLARAIANGPAEAPGGATDPSVNSWVSAPFRDEDALRRYAHVTVPYATRETGALLPKIACATLIVSGERDVIVPPDLSRRVWSALPQAELDVAPAGTHYRLYEDPALHRRIRGFLDART